MEYSLKWIKKYIDIDIPERELFEKLSMSGSEVEGYKELLTEIENVCIGKILKIEKHPNADKLQYCDVTDGKETFKVVCGAQNIHEKDIIPFAKIGAKLPGGVKIKKSKIRGVESQGMLCSQKELGFGEDHTGIFILDAQYKVGENFKKYFDDMIFEIEITPNRPDLLSHIGLVREIGALLGKGTRKPAVEEIRNTVDSPIKVKIEAKDACPRYSAIYISGITNGESTEEITYFIKTMGLNSKGLLVDISNFNLFDIGHPTHFFDADKIDGNITVRFAKKGEKCTTIDKENRVLSNKDLVIADDKKIIALAGVMGCMNSEVDKNTKNLFIESAIFAPSYIRETKKHYGIMSDAAYRFERGVDPEITPFSIKRVVYLLKQNTTFSGTSNILDSYPGRRDLPIITLKKENVEKILNIDLALDKITDILRSLGYKVEKLINNDIKVLVPSFRSYDTLREIDLIEEIGRIYGFNNVPEIRPYIRGKVRTNVFWDLKFKIRKYLSGRGFYETMTFSLIDETYIKNLGYKGKIKSLSNPLNIEQNIFSPWIFPRLLSVLKGNLKYKNKNIRLFEISHIYDGEEKEAISFLLYGNQELINWRNKEPNEMDIFNLKGELNAFFDLIGQNDLIYKNEELPFLVKGNSGGIYKGEEYLGFIGMVSPEFLPSKRIEKPVFIAELVLEPLLKKGIVKYTPISQYPAIERDISMIFKKDIQISEIKALIEKNGTVNLREINLMDVYEMNDKEDALMFRLNFQSQRKTLNDKAIEYLMGKIIGSLEEKLSGRLRK